jgi:diamine N-acetyltransferase
MKQLHIRKAGIEDAQFISLLARITFNETFGSCFRDNQDLLDYHDKTFPVSKIRSGIEKENNVFWIAFWDDLPIGYAKLKKKSKSDFIHSDNVSQLQKIYVLKDFISKKVGYQLLLEIFEEVKKINTDFLWLSVWENNERAISFYKKSGFVETGKHTFDIGKEHFVFTNMKKAIK